MTLLSKLWMFGWIGLIFSLINVGPSFAGDKYLSKKNDTKNVSNMQAVYGLRGKDKLSTSGQGFFYMYGGQGNDRYIIRNQPGSQFTYIFDSKGRDRVDAKALWASSSYTLEYGNHLMILDVGDAYFPDFVMVLNWKKKNNRIEKITTGDGYNWNYKQFKKAVYTGAGYLGKFNTRTMRAYTGVRVPSLSAFKKAVKKIEKKEKKYRNKRRFSGQTAENLGVGSAKNTVSWIDGHSTDNGMGSFLLSPSLSVDRDIKTLNLSHWKAVGKFDLGLSLIEGETTGSVEFHGLDATYSALVKNHQWTSSIGYREYAEFNLPIINAAEVPHFFNEGGSGMFVRQSYEFKSPNDLQFFASAEFGQITPDFSRNPLIEVDGNIIYSNAKAGVRYVREENNDSLVLGLSNSFSPLSGELINKIPYLFGDEVEHIGLRKNPYYFETTYNKAISDRASIDFTMISAPQASLDGASLFLSLNHAF
jgi:hypothetical protein